MTTPTLDDVGRQMMSDNAYISNTICTSLIPTDKKKDYFLLSSYRLIALENTIAKVIKKIITNKIISKAKSHGLIL